MPPHPQPITCGSGHARRDASGPERRPSTAVGPCRLRNAASTRRARVGVCRETREAKPKGVVSVRFAPVAAFCLIYGHPLHGKIVPDFGIRIGRLQYIRLLN